MVDSPQERARVSCALRDGTGAERPLVQRLQAQYRQATGQSPGVKAKSPGSGGKVKSAIGKGNKKAKEKKKQEPKKPATMEDLDAELLNYTAARSGAGRGVVQELGVQIFHRGRLLGLLLLLLLGLFVTLADRRLDLATAARRLGLDAR